VHGLALVVDGLLWPLSAKMGFGRLAGAFAIEHDNFHLCIALTSLLISVVPSVPLWLIDR